jgi:polar amino acid transport system substrate-binding protein
MIPIVFVQQVNMPPRSVSRFLLPLLMLLCGAAQANDAPKTITIEADQWCPINCEPGSAEEGIGIELARKVFEPLGYKVNYVVVPWARALSDAMEGKTDAVIGANNTDEPRLKFPKSAVYNMTDDFYMLKEKAVPFSNLSSLGGQRFGIIKEYGYNEELTRFLEQRRSKPGMVQEVSGDDALTQNIRKLQAGRIDVLVESRAVMDFTLNRKKLADSIVRVGGLPQGDVFLAFSPAKPDSGELTKKFDEGVARLKASGDIEKIYARYGLKYR